MSAAKKVLFFAEAVTLAHVARPLALATTLDQSRFEPVLACDSRYLRFCTGPWQILGLDSISSRVFAAALASGAPVYDAGTLRRYVRKDLELIDRIKPDVIVGDFRLSLSVSARLVGIPYISISNAYWSPYYSAKNSFPLPVLPITRWLPLPLAATLFRLGRPAAFRLHCRPLNSVRCENGLPSLGVDLRRVYTDADFTAYADMPELFPIGNLPPTHCYLGPILWSPPVPKPTWWDHLPSGRPVVYLTLGSSGDAGLLATVLKGLESLPVTVIASTAGAAMPGRLPANTHVADYLPGSEAASRSALVICNGGSLTCQQALAAGVPVVGIAGNMDQFLNMDALVRAGAGCLLRADRVDAARLGDMVSTALARDSLRRSASNLASKCTSNTLGSRFNDILGMALGGPPAPMSESLRKSPP